MAGTLGIVEVGTTFMGPLSLGLMSRRLGGKPLLEWVVRRVTESLLLDRVIVVVDPAMEDTVRTLTPQDISVFVSRQPDMLGRFAAAAREYDVHQLVRVGLDNPFVDPALIDRLVCTANTHPGCDYIGYYSHDGQPAAQSRLGVFAEWARADAIFKAEALADIDVDRQQATRYLYSHPELFQLRLIPVPAQLDRQDVRLSIGGEEDWENAQLILDALGPENLAWQKIAGLLDSQPRIRHHMAVLNGVGEE
ncbi:MAG: NTP transferase domain-containing protein [Pirellulaceae bacterium]|jgi:spore coat polysaccharide biosynthesis protein SpsF (cytidylyltransferase family)|nr:NTP transferase domain-containing protein [Pirellulaceae bacterium]